MAITFGSGNVFTVSTADDLNTVIANLDAIGKLGTTGLAAAAYTIRLGNDITLGARSGGLPTTYAALDATGAAAGTLTIESGSGGAQVAVAGSNQLYALNLSTGVSVTIDGDAHTLSGANTYNGFFVYSGQVAIQNLTIADAVARGGNGGSGGTGGGGGGAGLGGGLFVAGPNATAVGANTMTSGGVVTLSRVSFVNNAATGGDGGNTSGYSAGRSGGGGLDGGAGGSGTGSGNSLKGGGGGVGLSASGGSGTLDPGGNGILLGAAGGAASQIYQSGAPASGGAWGGGGGSGYDSGAGGVGASGPNGGFGGGGAEASSLGSAGFGGGGAGSSGGGFGGGGGGFGSGGFGAGNGTSGTGGGGLGAGADIFVQQGGSLTVVATGILGDGTVTGGSGGSTTNPGQNFGSSLFLQGNQTATFTPAANSTITVVGTIADQTGSGGTGPNAGAGGLTLNGNATGTLVLSGANTYTGTTTVTAGILNIQNASALGTTAGGTTVASGAALQLQGGIAVGAEALQLSGTGTGNGGALDSVSGANSYAGAITLAAASRINVDAGSLALTGAISATPTGAGLTLGGAAGNGSIAGAIVSSVGSLTKDGLNTWTLSGSNAYAGATTITAGTLALSGAGSIAASSGVVANGTFDISGLNAGVAASIKALTGTAAGGLVTLGAHDLNLAAASGSYAGQIQGTGALNLQAGSQILTGHSSAYSGAVNLGAGTTLSVQQLDAAGTGLLTFGSGAQNLILTVDGTYADRFTGFGVEDTITAASVTYNASTSASYNAGTHVLTITNGAHTEVLQFDAGYTPQAGYQFNVSAGAFGTTNVTLGLIPPPPPSGTTVTTNSTGGHDVTTSDPSAIQSQATSAIDTVIYSGTQPLTLPTGFENAILSGQGGTATGNSGNNAFVITSGSWTIDGRGGSDVVVFSTEASAHTFQLIDANNVVVTGAEGTQRLAGISGLGFAHDQITFDFGSQAAQVVRLYDATLHRQADIGGGTNALAQLQGGVTLAQLSQAFLNSAEGQSQYAPSQTNQQFVDALYANVLHRAADAQGEANWVAALDAGRLTRGAELAAFSESAEHVGFVGTNYVVGLVVDHPLA